jgi:hypothetical protein
MTESEILIPILLPMLRVIELLTVAWWLLRIGTRDIIIKKRRIVLHFGWKIWIASNQNMAILAVFIRRTSGSAASSLKTIPTYMDRSCKTRRCKG